MRLLSGGSVVTRVEALVARELAEKAVEQALKHALAEIRRQGGPDYLIIEALNEGLGAAKPFLDAIATK